MAFKNENLRPLYVTDNGDVTLERMEGVGPLLNRDNILLLDEDSQYVVARNPEGTTVPYHTLTGFVGVRELNDENPVFEEYMPTPPGVPSFTQPYHFTHEINESLEAYTRQPEDVE